MCSVFGVRLGRVSVRLLADWAEFPGNDPRSVWSRKTETANAVPP